MLTSTRDELQCGLRKLLQPAGKGCCPPAVAKAIFCLKQNNDVSLILVFSTKVGVMPMSLPIAEWCKWMNSLCMNSDLAFIKHYGEGLRFLISPSDSSGSVGFSFEGPAASRVTDGAPVAVYCVSESGGHIITGAGKPQLEVCLKDLEDHALLH